MTEFLHMLSGSAKDVSALAGAASAIAYAFGFLVLRGRSMALGLEPALELLSAAYVFAGYRFISATGFFLLLLAAPTALVTGLAWPWIQPWFGSNVRWVCVAILGVGTVTLLAFLARVRGTLLTVRPNSASARGDAGFPVSLLATGGAAATLYWLDALFSEPKAGGAIVVVLVLIAALQLVALPLLHGVFYADRQVRELSRLPDGIVSVHRPIWLVDRTKDRVTLFACDAAGAPVLLSLAATRIDGIPMTRLARLDEMLGAASRAMPLAAAICAMTLMGGS